ncbi:hypothetical protein JWH11_17400 [Xanthomonas melonis]|uniref:Uncharacterized protein n=1 Tax=Xanthomonas melonis TaxID=56456 RepID=A0ABS8NYK8_9XANT|nr:hypothetical protein [Xanthomonas melonis]MCD0247120.1 hypothetical protein [Xanthomonas melonis]MCD0259593.1 hypothetical protein [Xanthomonas melonis]MCD0268170.1 hypothetical protein [Xanthomonas melonis]
MGTLQVCCYPTTIALNLADHTYVSCGSGAFAWGCWGGKQGGTVVDVGNGSTLRAEKIAEPDERAGITHYLVNGVCHQAANRILKPADIVAENARGYLLSVALFHIYGRESAGLGLFKAPYFEYVGVSGDIGQCLSASHTSSIDNTPVGAAAGGHSRAFMRESLVLHELERNWLEELQDDFKINELTSPDVLEKNLRKLWDERAEQVLAFELQHFGLLLRYRSRLRGEDFEKSIYMELMNIRRRFELNRLRLELALAVDPVNRWIAFVNFFDELVVNFQADLQQALNDRDYVALLDISPNERIVLSDPEIVKNAYSPGSSPNRPRPPGL